LLTFAFHLAISASVTYRLLGLAPPVPSFPILAKRSSRITLASVMFYFLLSMFSRSFSLSSNSSLSLLDVLGSL